MPGQLAMFMSYAVADDEDDGGQLSEFRGRLEAAVRMATGDAFSIFQDRNDIRWGQNWQQRIDDALDEVTLLLVILTPRFFRSEACRSEVERFLTREQQLGRDLVLPIYYVGDELLDDPQQRNQDELARILHARQYSDWRELRYHAFDSPAVRRELTRLATRIRDTFRRPVATPPVHPTEPDRSAESSAEPTGPATTTAEPAKEPPTHVVDPYHRGDFPTIGEAIAAARPGDRILVRPGFYPESLVIDKPLEILGDGPVADIEIHARDANALVFRANIGRVANLTVRQSGGGSWYGVDIAQGRLELEGCDISSQSLACVAIRLGADPRLRRNHIHDGRETGVYIYEDGLGTLEDNEITANAGIGVAIKGGADPTLRRNHIRHNRQSGVVVYDGGRGTLEHNQISANALSGLAIRTHGNPTVRRNQVSDNVQCGVFVYSDGQGTLEYNDISENTLAGVEIKTGGRPVLRHNQVNRNGYEAIWVYDGGGGVVEDNDLTDNARGAWDIGTDCLPAVIRARNQE